MKDNTFHCKNCGAPVTTELCPYCNSFTGLETADADMEYPVVECKESALGFWNVIFPAIFAFAFGFAGFFSLISFLFADIPTGVMSVASIIYTLGFFLPFAIIGIVAAVITVKPIIRYLSVKRHGIEIEGIVYGYMDDNLFINNVPAQIVKILIDTPKGKRFILYQLGDVKKPYKLNSKINLLVYKNYFIIKENKEYLYQ